MALLSNSVVAALVLIAFALSNCFYMNNLSDRETKLVRCVHAEPNESIAYERLVIANPTETHNKPSENHPESFKETTNYGDDKCTMAPQSRFDCARDRVLSKRQCEERGCCYAPLPKSVGPPWCFYPSLYPGYKLGPFTPSKRGLAVTLTRAKPSYLPRDVSTLRLEIIEETTGCLHLILKDPSSQRYEVKLPADVPQSRADNSDVLYTTEYQSDPFGFIVRRKSNGHTIINTTVGPLLFADQYLQLSTTLASSLVSGLGEHYTFLLLDLNWTSLTLWNRDMAPHAHANLYGSHPFYIVQEADGLAHGVFLLNSNAIEVTLQPTPALTWVSTGGILDLYFFLGPDPQSVIRQYLQVIGHPMMPPYWSLGFHLCRWGYTTTNTTRKVAQRMHNANLPLDVQWNDLDYADKRRIFTFDPWRFGDLPEMVEEFHRRGMKYILILMAAKASQLLTAVLCWFLPQDPGISSTSPTGTYPPFDDGLKRDVFIKNVTGQILIGKVWPGPTAFPDFTNPETRQWWEDCIRDFHSKVPVDGLWIDMNEPANFVQGSMEGCPHTDLEDPPYTPRVGGGELNSGTLCMSAQQRQSTHYNLHNMYGLTEAYATNRALTKVRGKRPFVLSRSSYSGIGRFSGVWTGDVRSDWEQLRFSIPAVLQFSLFGVPLVGADICGFEGNTTEELCGRWMQLGAFYPFMRNHNDNFNAPQEPYVFGQEAQAAMRSALNLRYSLLPFLYTLFHHAHTSADTVARPLFMEFPTDPNCQTIDRQFLWGSSLLISPVLEQGSVKLTAYLPFGIWYNLHNGQPFYSKGQYLLLSAPLDTINVHVREGHIIPQQDPALTTTASRRNPFFLTVALSAGGRAWGDLFWDDGDSLDTYKTQDYCYVIFTAGQSQVVSDPLMLNGALDELVLGGLQVFGVPSPPRYVLANGEKVSDFMYHSDTKVLTVTKLTLPMAKVFTVQWAL
ncbi:lysosomal alpha-glucosidase-like isoform X3 [Solea solea]|uniref:lysosomal alpha-glucosidase-like isoform X3 n=1 Tax=Solea solea TaxID=90069 RepID=UPI00272A2EF1|nr:lysosomal alpha-glucosidase-like isoform X3 [Solea solea]